MSARRLAWRRAIEQSRLPNGVKLTALKHSERGRHQFHNEAANEHAITRDRLAQARGIHPRKVQAHLRRLEDEGWAVLHRCGHRGQQAVYHYTFQGERWACDSCELAYPKQPPKQPRKGAAKGAAIDPDREPTTTPYPDTGKGAALGSPSSTYRQPVADVATGLTADLPNTDASERNAGPDLSAHCASHRASLIAENLAGPDRNARETRPTRRSET
jgi:hypothetical protein